MQRLATIGYEMKKALADRKSNNSNVRSAWRPVSGSPTAYYYMPSAVTVNSIKLHVHIANVPEDVENDDAFDRWNVNQLAVHF